MWLELHPSSRIPEPLNIKPKPPAKFQVRVIVWRCKNVANQAWEGVSDLYVRAVVNNELA